MRVWAALLISKSSQPHTAGRVQSETKQRYSRTIVLHKLYNSTEHDYKELNKTTQN